MKPVIEVFNHAIMITGFVFVMMLVIEYINVLTRGSWQERVMKARMGQYIFAAVMGIIPGCMGVFVVVAMYSHRMVTLGAVTAAMIATSGDESFVMLAMIPRDAVLLMGLLFVIGIGIGIVTDIFMGKNKFSLPSMLRGGKLPDQGHCDGLALHQDDMCRCFPKGEIISQWKKSSPNRIILWVVLGLLIVAILSGQVGPETWNWIRVSILVVTVLALFIVSTVPEHFLKEHLWDHVARKHVPRIFLWTFGALLVMHILIEQLQLEELIRQNLWVVLGAASLLGVIPESGPHLVFVTLFAGGTIPFSILLASSIVQDGHGMLPLLAHSPRTFILIKLINLVAGFLIGAILLLLIQ